MKKTAAIVLFSLLAIPAAFCQKGKDEAPLLLETIKAEVNKQMTDSAIANLEYLFANLKPDNSTKAQARLVAQNLYDTLINEAERKLNADYIADAESKYDKAANFCKTLDPKICTVKGKNGLVSAKSAMYNDLIAKAKIELEDGNLTDAETLANKAKTYASQNQETIKTCTEADFVIAGIRQKYYKRYLMKVKNSIEEKHYNTALMHLREADTYLKDNGLKRDAAYFQLLKTASKPVIAALIEKANSNNDNITKARLYYYSADSLAHQSGLNEGHLKDELDALGKKVENNDCMYWQTAFKNLLSKASAFEADKNFTGALETYTYAAGKKDSVPGCLVDFQLAENKIKELKPAANFQSLMASSVQAEKDNRFAIAIQNYDSAENILIHDSLSKYNLPAKTTYNYILEHSDPAFLIAGATFFTGISLPDKAINLLKEALNNNYPPNATKDLQHAIATQLADSDFKTQPSENPKKLADQYCGNDEKLSPLKKAYLKARKALK